MNSRWQSSAGKKQAGAQVTKNVLSLSTHLGGMITKMLSPYHSGLSSETLTSNRQFHKAADEMNNIRDEQDLLQSDWAGEQKLKHLTKRSSGLFIYAAIVCRFIHEWLSGMYRDIVLQGSDDGQSPE